MGIIGARTGISGRNCSFKKEEKKEGKERETERNYFPASQSLKSPDLSVLEILSVSHVGRSVILIRDLE